MDWTQKMINGLARIMDTELSVPMGKRDRPLLDRIMKARWYLAHRLRRKTKRSNRATTTDRLHES